MHAGFFRRYSHALKGKRVLIVEDEALVAEIFQDALIEAGAEVVGPAVSAHDALLLIQGATAADGLSAAILDMNLDGAAMSTIADQLSASGVPFVRIAGYGGNPDGCVHASSPVLVKPFSPGALVCTVRDLMVER